MKKRVTLYSDPDNIDCRRVEKYLSEQDIILNVHDIKKQPLDLKQISKLIRSFDLKHFYSSNGHSKGKKKTTTTETIDRQTMLDNLAEDNSLLRLPIILSGRLLTIGNNCERIGIMLQITPAEAR